MAIEMRYIAAFHLRKRTSKCELKMAFLICRMLCQRYVWCLLLCYIRCNVCLLFFFTQFFYLISSCHQKGARRNTLPPKKVLAGGPLCIIYL